MNDSPLRKYLREQEQKKARKELEELRPKMYKTIAKVNNGNADLIPIENKLVLRYRELLKIIAE
jgi:hypothetical protein